MTGRPAVAGLAALAAAAAIAGCSSASAPATKSQPARGTTATHWWSGSDYCAILRQTMRAGPSILAGAPADDPQRVAATRSFVSDLTAAAPPGVRASWQVLGPAVTQLVESRGRLTAVRGTNTRDVSAAAAAIAADASTRCHLDVGA